VPPSSVKYLSFETEFVLTYLASYIQKWSSVSSGIRKPDVFGAFNVPPELRFKQYPVSVGYEKTNKENKRSEFRRYSYANLFLIGVPRSWKEI
jgi:hypothetical protein